MHTINPYAVSVYTNRKSQIPQGSRSPKSQRRARATDNPMLTFSHEQITPLEQCMHAFFATVNQKGYASVNSHIIPEPSDKIPQSQTKRASIFLDYQQKEQERGGPVANDCSHVGSRGRHCVYVSGLRNPFYYRPRHTTENRHSSLLTVNACSTLSLLLPLSVSLLASKAIQIRDGKSDKRVASRFPLRLLQLAASGLEPETCGL
jgi:hypothetical protein